MEFMYKFSGTGEWWNKNVEDVEIDGLLTGLGPVMSDAFTINGFTGEQPSCRGTTRTHDHAPVLRYEIRVSAGIT
jgi:hypothetical protein